MIEILKSIPIFKYLAIFLLLVVIVLSIVVGVQSHQKNNLSEQIRDKELTIDELEKQLQLKEFEIQSLQKGLSLVENLNKKEEEVIKHDSDTKEELLETVLSSEEAKDWWNTPVPNDIRDLLVCE